MHASNLWHCWAAGTLIEYLRYTLGRPARYWGQFNPPGEVFNLAEAADGPVASISA
jgi:hypothetical protein